MAQRVVTTLVDDLDGGEATETVGFALDGVSYDIDLSANNAGVLRDIMGDFTDAARKVTKANFRGALRHEARSPVDREGIAKIRTWGRANGWTVSDRGRLSAEVVAAYRAGTPKLETVG